MAWRPKNWKRPAMPESWWHNPDVAFEAGADAMHRGDIEWLKEHSSKLKYDPTAIVIDIEDWGKFIGEE